MLAVLILRRIAYALLALFRSVTLRSDENRATRWKAFYFLHRDLGLSKGAAYYRKVAAELVQRFPEIVEPLRDGRLCLTSVVELAKVITSENRAEVLPRFFHCSKREAKAVSAEIMPTEAAPSREIVTAVRVEAPAMPARPAQASAPPASAADVHGQLATKCPVRVDPALGWPDEPARTPATSDRAPAPPCDQRDVVEPLSAELRRLHVTVSRRFLEKLEAARAGLSHSLPRGSTEEILEAALDLLLREQGKKKGIVERPRKVSPPSTPEHIPAAVKREVWTRDDGCCQWPVASGGVCSSRVRIQFDHRIPRAKGGSSTVSNFRLLCAFHNGLAARRAFGDDWIDRFSGRRPAARDSADAGAAV
jgi:5-methylcytosine-specific restriction endonuclease McrA